MMRRVDTESSHCITIFPLGAMRDTRKIWQGLNISLRRRGRRELRHLISPELVLILARMTGAASHRRGWHGLDTFLRKWGCRGAGPVSHMTELTSPRPRRSRIVISKAASHSGVRRGWQGLSTFLRKWGCRGVRLLVVRKQLRGARRTRARVWGCDRPYCSPACTIGLTPPSPHRSRFVISKAASHRGVRRG